MDEPKMIEESVAAREVFEMARRLTSLEDLVQQQVRATYCVFCGWSEEFRNREGALEACREHVSECPQHPLRKSLEEVYVAVLQGKEPLVLLEMLRAAPFKLVCAGGIVGCNGGPGCTSDHK